jgi:small conductance mechanosensitive channel
MNESSHQAIEFTDYVMDLILTYGPKVVLALVTLIIGLWLIKAITRGIGNNLTRGKVDPSLVPFLKTLLSTILKIGLFISVIGMIGIEATSFIAIFGAAGLAVGLALQGTLQNFAGGVIILLLKPFKVGDFIDAVGYMGTVNAIQIFNTHLKTPDNKTIIIPNGQLANSSLTNFSAEPERRVDWTFGVGYGDSAEVTKQVLHDLINEDDRILKEPEPFIALSELADSSVNFVVRVWVKAPDYWNVYFDMNEKVYKKFAEEGLNIPFPQMDVHLHKED